jgi:hypothetical protein
MISSVALEAIKRIDDLFDIERVSNGMRMKNACACDKHKVGHS